MRNRHALGKQVGVANGLAALMTGEAIRSVVIH
jgi:hypothetical protein